MIFAEECTCLFPNKTNSFCWVFKVLFDKSLYRMGAVMEALRRIGVSVVIVLFLTVGLSYGQNPAEQSYTKGVKSAAQGKFEEAREEFEEALNTELEIQPSKEQSAKRAPYFLEHIRQIVERKYGRHLLYNGGLKIHTTVDLPMQIEAKNAIQMGGFNNRY